MNEKTVGRAVAITCVCLAVSQPAMAIDLFADAKTAIKETAGVGSGVESAILAAGALGAVLTGFITKNWIGAIAGFTVGIIFWNIAAPIAGL
jgi:type IV conjugative transfer system pilin TraA